MGPCYRSFGWNELPRDFGVSPATANRRFREWTRTGAWNRFWDGLARLRPAMTMPRTTKSRTVTVLIELQRAYNVFNAWLFNNSLPPTVVITVEWLRHKRYVQGYFHPLPPHGHIAVAFRTLEQGPRAVLHTLLHEMVHLRNHVVGLPDVHGRYHNRHFRDTAALAGLTCTRENNIGYGDTGLGRRAKSAIKKLRPVRRAYRWPREDTPAD